MTHLAQREVPGVTGVTHTMTGLKVPFSTKTFEYYIKWDLKEDFQRLQNLANLLLSTLHIKKINK